MLKYDTVGVKCPGCGTMVAQKVLAQDYKDGKVVLTCHICGQRIHISAPEPFFKMFAGENQRMLKMNGEIFREMGWATVVWLIIWGVGWFYLEKQLGWPRWIASLAPGIPFLIFFFRTSNKVIKEHLQEDLGVPRSSAAYAGMRESDAIKVYSIDEEYHFIASRQCPACQGMLKTGSHGVSFSNADAERIAHNKAPRLDRMYDHIEATCQACNRTWRFYFDISQIDYVKRMGYTQEMVLYHMQSVAKRSKGK